jgi:hypothetical protein
MTTTWTRETMQHEVARRDSCSGGRSAGCITCGLRHSCGLDDTAAVCTQALRGFSALNSLSGGIYDAQRADWSEEAIARLIRQAMTVRAILREIEWNTDGDL